MVLEMMKVITSREWSIWDKNAHPIRMVLDPLQARMMDPID